MAAKTLQEQLTALQAEVTQGVEALATQATEHATALTALEAKVTVAEGAATVAASDLAGVQEKLTAAEGKCEVLAGQLKDKTLEAAQNIVATGEVEKLKGQLALSGPHKNLSVGQTTVPAATPATCDGAQGGGRDFYAEYLALVASGKHGKALSFATKHEKEMQEGMSAQLAADPDAEKGI